MAKNGKQMEAFLQERQIARIATIGKDGQPHVKPIWYRYEGGKFFISTGDDSITVRNLKRDPRTTLCIDDPNPPYRGVIVEGTAEIKFGFGKDPEGISAMAFRYLGEEGKKWFMQSPAAQKMRVRIYVTPKRWMVWDYGRGIV